MNKFLMLLAATLIVGCGKKTELVDIYKGDPGNNGVSMICSVQQLENGLRMSCSDGSYAEVLNGFSGSNGSNGLSAYEIALENGFEGSESEWLESLNGTDGTNGTNGSGGGATVTLLTATSCTAVAGSSPTHYVKSGDLFTGSTCHSSTKISLQVGESVFVASKMVVARDASGLRSILWN